MKFYESVLLFLQGEMKSPLPYGRFHFGWICLTISLIVFLYSIRKKKSEKQLKMVLGIYGIGALILETLKQVIWSFNYEPLTKIAVWDFEWYAFPFQLCTTPIFVSIMCLFLKNNKVRESLLSYLAFTTILGSFLTILLPDSCFTSDILVNVHTMWLHCGSFVVSIYLLMAGRIKINIQNLKRAIVVFLIFVLIAMILNIGIYNSGILNGETFNMFYISPYFISSLPVFDVIQQNVPYILYLSIYIFAISLGSFIVYYIAKFAKEI